MLRTLLSLKLRIMRSAMSGSPVKLIFGFGFLALSGFGSIYSASKLAAAAQKGGANATESLVMGCTILFGLWVFGPLLVGGVDDALGEDVATCRNGERAWWWLEPLRAYSPNRRCRIC